MLSQQNISTICVIWAFWNYLFRQLIDFVCSKTHYDLFQTLSNMQCFSLLRNVCPVDGLRPWGLTSFPWNRKFSIKIIIDWLLNFNLNLMEFSCTVEWTRFTMRRRYLHMVDRNKLICTKAALSDSKRTNCTLRDLKSYLMDHFFKPHKGSLESHQGHKAIHVLPCFLGNLHNLLLS